MQYRAKLISKNTQDEVYKALKKAISEITTDPELIENTPTRWIKAFDEWFSNSKEDLTTIGKNICKVFPSKNDNMVVVTNIKVWATCQHHLCPFETHIAIGVLPLGGKVMGLSKYTRLVRAIARRFDSGIVEDFVENISTALRSALETDNVAVVAYSKEGDVHTCCASRGANDSNMEVMASSMKGAFRDQAETRAEFLSFIKK